MVMICARRPHSLANASSLPDNGRKMTESYLLESRGGPELSAALSHISPKHYFIFSPSSKIEVLMADNFGISRRFLFMVVPAS